MSATEKRWRHFILMISNNCIYFLNDCVYMPRLFVIGGTVRDAVYCANVPHRTEAQRYARFRRVVHDVDLTMVSGQHNVQYTNAGERYSMGHRLSNLTTTLCTGPRVFFTYPPPAASPPPPPLESFPRAPRPPHARPLSPTAPPGTPSAPVEASAPGRPAPPAPPRCGGARRAVGATRRRRGERTWRHRGPRARRRHHGPPLSKAG